MGSPEAHSVAPLRKQKTAAGTFHTAAVLKGDALLLLFRDAPSPVVDDQPFPFLFHPCAGVPATLRAGRVTAASVFPNTCLDDNATREDFTFNLRDCLFLVGFSNKAFFKLFLQRFSAAMVNIVVVDDVGFHVV